MPKRKAEGGESAPAERPRVRSTGGYVCEWVADPAFADLEGEIWAKIPKSSLVRKKKAKKAYVSNLGRYKNCFGVVSWPKPREDHYCYIIVGRKNVRMGRIVQIAFGSPRPSPKHTAQHINQIRSDNRLVNLTWFTPSEQAKDSYANNPNRGSSAGKLSMPVKVRPLGEGGRQVGGVWTSYPSANEAARQLGINSGRISRECRKEGGGAAQGFHFEFDEPNEAPLREGEEWRQVLSHHGNAAVSNLGRFRDTNGIVKTPMREASGYVRVVIDGDSHPVHRLQAEVFLPPPLPGQTEVNHRSTCTWDNRIENLEWITPSGNKKHSYAKNPNRASNAPRMSKKVRCRKVGEVSEDSWLYFDSSHEAARKLNLNQGGISTVCKANAERKSRV